MKQLGTRTLETKRLLLRRLTKEDAIEAYNNWCSKEEVARYVLFERHDNIEVTKDLFDSWEKEYKDLDTYRWIVELKDTNELIGTIDVSNVMVVCPECGKPTRVKHNTVDGKNVRVCKCGYVLDKKYEKATKKKSTTTKTKKAASEVKEAEAKTAKKTKLEKTEKPARTTSTKNKAEGASVKRKQGM